MYKKGDKIKVEGDSIHKMMGIEPATGTIVVTSKDGSRIIGFKCDQTGRIEGVSDGKVTIQPGVNE